MNDSRAVLRRSPLHLAAALWLLTGCATIFTGTTDKLKFDANIPGVRLTVDGHYLGDLPLELEMSRNFVGGRQFAARFEAPGYATQQFVLTREFNPVAVLDITGVITSGGIDVLTGAIMRFAPRQYYLQMLPAAADPRSAAVAHGREVCLFALANFETLRKDLSRGGGESLRTLAALAGGLEAQEVAEAALRGRRFLTAAPSAPAFVQRLDTVLAELPLL